MYFIKPKTVDKIIRPEHNVAVNINFIYYIFYIIMYFIFTNT